MVRLHKRHFVSLHYAGLLVLLLAVLAACKSRSPGSEFLGQQVPISFTALDGREVDLAKMRGKVVLVDFFATWCPPCMREVPTIKQTYEKLHPRGFEVVAISFDDKKQDVEKFVLENKIEWPQYFDGKGGDNQFGRKFKIEEIPVMWLIDKQGKLRELDATENLAAKAEKLLSEK